jgi:HK97 family phage prohead protease
MIEQRALAFDHPRVERRTQGVTVAGIAVPFGVPELVNGVFVEVWAPDSLNDQARSGWVFDGGGPNRSVLSLYNHNTDRVLGSVAAGTLRLTVTSGGLRYQLNLPESAADVAEAVMRGDVNGASVSFIATQDVWGYDNDVATRRIITASLREVSLCAWPVYTDSSATVAGPLTGRSMHRPTERRRGGKQPTTPTITLDAARREVQARRQRHDRDDPVRRLLREADLMRLTLDQMAWDRIVGRRR